MGPIALFDKSFLQSLSLTESVFFDHSLAFRELDPTDPDTCKLKSSDLAVGALRRNLLPISLSVEWMLSDARQRNVYQACWKYFLFVRVDMTTATRLIFST